MQSVIGASPGHTHLLFDICMLTKRHRTDSHNTLNPFMPNGTSHSYQLDQSISVFRVVECYFSLLFKF